MPVLSIVLTVLGVVESGEAPALGGVVYTGRSVELVKRVDLSPRSVIHGDAIVDEATQNRRFAEAQRALDELGRDLDAYLTALRAPDSPYPVAAKVILDYAYLVPRDYSPANGRLYVMYAGELAWRFPAPLVCDLVRLRVADPLPQAFHDVLTAVLRRWGRDHIDGPRDAGEREQVRAALGELGRGGTRGARAGVELSRARLVSEDVRALKELLAAPDPEVRAAAVGALGAGGWLTDPAPYAALLMDGDVEVRHAAFWALMTLPGRGGLSQVRGFAGRREVVAARLRETRAEVTDLHIDADLAQVERVLDAVVP